MSELTATAHEGYVFLDVPDDYGCLTYEQTGELISRLQCAARDAFDQRSKTATGDSVSRVRSSVWVLMGYTADGTPKVVIQ